MILYEGCLRAGPIEERENCRKEQSVSIISPSPLIIGTIVLRSAKLQKYVLSAVIFPSYIVVCKSISKPISEILRRARTICLLP